MKAKTYRDLRVLYKQWIDKECGHVRHYIGNNKSENCEHNSMDKVLSDTVRTE